MLNLGNQRRENHLFFIKICFGRNNSGQIFIKITLTLVFLVQLPSQILAFFGCITVAECLWLSNSVSEELPIRLADATIWFGITLASMEAAKALRTGKAVNVVAMPASVAA